MYIPQYVLHVSFSQTFVLHPLAFDVGFGTIKILKHSTLAACHLFVWALCLYCTLCSLALGVWEKKADQVMCN